jgi:HlyD family secretion protein
MKKVSRVLMIAFIAGVVLSSCGGPGGNKRVSVEEVEKRTIIETVSADGKIQPEIEVKISSEISGEIIKLNVKEGDTVKMGDLLVEVNPDIYRSAVERTQASLMGSKANVANSKARLAQVKAQFINAQATFSRNEKLKNSGAISDADYDAALSAFEVAKADVEAASQSVIASQFTVASSEATLKEANDNLRKTKIFAPVNGNIYSLSVEEGERVVGTSQMAGTELFRIANLNLMEVSVDVNENDIIRVKPGDTTQVEVDAYLKDKFIGIVTEIANSATNELQSTDQVTNFNVKIRILPSSYEHIQKNSSMPVFRPGMSASVEVQTSKMKDVITVPIQSVTLRKEEVDSTSSEKNQDGKECVFVVKEDKAYVKFVTVGIQDNNYIQILNGVEEGEEVVVSPFRTISKELENEMVVRKVDRSTLFETE